MTAGASTVTATLTEGLSDHSVISANLVQTDESVRARWRCCDKQQRVQRSICSGLVM